MLKLAPLILRNVLRSRRRTLLTLASTAVSLAILSLMVALYQGFFYADDVSEAGAVFVVENGKAVRRPVTVGMTALNGEVEIKQGLIGGEDLIVRPPEDLRAGDKVIMQNSKF